MKKGWIRLLIFIFAATPSCRTFAQDGGRITRDSIYRQYECWYILTAADVYMTPLIEVERSFKQEVTGKSVALSYVLKGSKLAGNNDALAASAIRKAHLKWGPGAAAHQGMTKIEFNEGKNKVAKAFSDEWLECVGNAPAFPPDIFKN